MALRRKINEMADDSCSREDINRLRQETFEGRRRLLLKKGSLEVMKEYPRLFEDDGVSILFQRPGLLDILSFFHWNLINCRFTHIY